MEELHKPVLITEVLEVLNPQPGEAYLDLTAGYGGHASEVLDLTRNYKDSVLIDRDEFAVEYLKGKYKSEPLEIVNDDFYSSVLKIVECGKTFDLILADFGVSSPQLDRQERGFSFLKDGPLDMRMDRSQELTADYVVNHYPERKLAEILEKYGEERPGNAKRLAREIVHARPFTSTLQLAEFIKSKSRYSKMHPATRVFQAIRIEVNDELGLIERTLPLIPKVLKPGGRVAIITFHSLEDRLVKQYFREESSYGEESELMILTKTPVVASAVELVSNPRSRSAKLRAAKRN
ncbi:MAG: 16S rRNA (cytosine(1402)-N(4))-methyltransferase RsmH [Bacteroidaceae bacterium]|nr:16S rRNA (cytosine(1402)-N(4))-methyltransferase RsmH [Bacteroidaceae bacterium]MBR3594898.1 16S rRNA (cytosine(1402)-N(4))-methyltransferase RsmH [Candidatus Saccharibacteria bacterium]MBR6122183.1 16S rRNA (cytosine(1402)-N(4))-methyltransferase RsmH [Candidatus Saccharibacteria bacterium]